MLSFVFLFKLQIELALSLLLQSFFKSKSLSFLPIYYATSFILINLRGYNRNLRKEISSKSKYYFYDNGIRNAIISNFNPLNLRDDIGKLWENFLVIERIKKQTYHKLFANNYFWRTWDQKEVDFVEEKEGKLFGYEFKYSPAKNKIQVDFLKAYPGSELSMITSQNYLDFIT